MLGSCLQLSSISSANSGYNGMFSLADILKIAVVIRRVAVFSGRRSAIFSSQNVRNFSPFSPAPPKKAELTQPRPRDIYSVPMHFLLIACIIDVTWSDIANFFQTLAGYEEVAREFEPIKHGEMFWHITRHTSRKAYPLDFPDSVSLTSRRLLIAPYLFYM